MLASGRQVLERFFPGVSQELMDAGAQSGDMIASRSGFRGRPVRQSERPERTAAQPAPHRFAVRKRVLAIPNPEGH